MGFFTSRNAYSTLSRFFASLHNSSPIVVRVKHLIIRVPRDERQDANEILSTLLSPLPPGKFRFRLPPQLLPSC